jgi:hypothetical protein
MNQKPNRQVNMNASLATVQIDIKPTMAALSALEKEQVPFVLAKTLTDVALGSQQTIREGMPKRFHIRSKWEISGVRIEPAKKIDIKTYGYAESVVKHIDPYMALQETGGSKDPKKTRALAIPEKKFEQTGIRGSSGAIKRKFLPAQLLKDYKGQAWYKQRHPGRKHGKRRKPKPFIIEKNGRVFVAIRGAESRYPIEYLYVFAAHAHIKPRFDFQKTVEQYVAGNFEKKFSENMLAALTDRKE